MREQSGNRLDIDWKSTVGPYNF